MNSSQMTVAATSGRAEPNGARVAYACDRCDTVIFTSDQIIGRRPLWDLGEYKADSFLISRPHDWSRLRRYDTSLHQGWYCCRFILMRMTVDKFGTGDALIVYTDSVHQVSDEAPFQAETNQLRRLRGNDFDQVVSSSELLDRLVVVKFGAIWCPPCRLMDAAISRIQAEGGMDGIDFYEVDVDEEPELATRFPSLSIPYTTMWFAGRMLHIRSDRLRTHAGGILGGLGRPELLRLLPEVRRQALESAGQALIQTA